MSDMKHLSVVDGALLHLESPEMPMHLGSLALFDAPSGCRCRCTWRDAGRACAAGARCASRGRSARAHCRTR
jgi:hypothetical protein